jgi:hypothetical protein
VEEEEEDDDDEDDEDEDVRGEHEEEIEDQKEWEAAERWDAGATLDEDEDCEDDIAREQQQTPAMHQEQVEQEEDAEEERRRIEVEDRWYAFAGLLAREGTALAWEQIGELHAFAATEALAATRRVREALDQLQQERQRRIQNDERRRQ